MYNYSFYLKQVFHIYKLMYTDIKKGKILKIE